MRFDGRAVLITGGSSGIGAACAQRFCELGAQVSIVDKQPPERSDDKQLLIIGDITDPTVRRGAVERTLSRYGRIDILVNNVGVGMYERASLSTLDDDLHLITTNVLSAVAMAQLVIPHMRAKCEGWIANISSVGAYVGLPWSAAYCASKSAFHSYGESLRRELRGSGIHVSTIVPGIVATEFRQHVISGAAPSGVVNIRRVVSAEDVALAVVRGIAQRRRRIFIPWYGRVFAALDFVLPGVMDAYIARKWSPAEPAAAPEEFASAAARARATSDVQS
jgi:short-subunit dehydrogenase